MQRNTLNKPKIKRVFVTGEGGGEGSFYPDFSSCIAFPFLILPIYFVYLNLFIYLHMYFLLCHYSCSFFLSLNQFIFLFYTIPIIIFSHTPGSLFLPIFPIHPSRHSINPSSASFPSSLSFLPIILFLLPLHLVPHFIILSLPLFLFFRSP